VQEGSEQALYFDADILDVQRRRHDVRGCRCRFWVRYRHDQTEVRVFIDVAQSHSNFFDEMIKSCPFACHANFKRILLWFGNT